MNAAIREITQLQEEKNLTIEQASREYRFRTIGKHIDEVKDPKARQVLREIVNEVFK